MSTFNFFLHQNDKTEEMEMDAWTFMVCMVCTILHYICVLECCTLVGIALFKAVAKVPTRL